MVQGARNTEKPLFGPLLHLCLAPRALEQQPGESHSGPGRLWDFGAAGISN